MPRVKPLGSFRMQLEATAKRAKDGEVARSRDILRELEELRAAIKAHDGIRVTDQEFASMIGMTPRHYRVIKENPLKLTVDEIRSIRAVGNMVGKSVGVGVAEVAG